MGPPQGPNNNNLGLGVTAADLKDNAKSSYDITKPAPNGGPGGTRIDFALAMRNDSKTPGRVDLVLAKELIEVLKAPPGLGLRAGADHLPLVFKANCWVRDDAAAGAEGKMTSCTT